MAHAQQLFFVSSIKQFLPRYFKDAKVLEVGSLNLNGTIRDMFEGCEYIGLDVGSGRDVDVVCPGEDYGAAADSFDHVVSCEAMEHNPQWRKTWINMIRLMKPAGLLVMTCATSGRRQHGTQQYLPQDSPLTLQKGQDYYRNLTQEDFSSLARMDAWFSVHAFYGDPTSHDLYFFGIGREAPADVQSAATQLAAALNEHYYKRNILGLY